MKPPIVIGHITTTYHKKQVEEVELKVMDEIESYQTYKTGQELRRERRKNKRNGKR